MIKFIRAGKIVDAKSTLEDIYLSVVPINDFIKAVGMLDWLNQLKICLNEY
jgi:hypothetical protein